MTSLPEDTHLAYVVSHDAWYARTPGVVDQPNIMVMASTTGGGCAWEFSATEHDFGSHGGAIRVAVFDDAFAAFAQIPEFFARLASEGITTLSGVAVLLDSMGAVDETDRRGPSRNEDGPTASRAGKLGKALRGASVASTGEHGERVLIVPEKAIPAIEQSVFNGDGEA